MMNEVQKVTRAHLCRNAYLYIRQATIHEGIVNRGSLQRQYALHQKAIALGWPSERVVVIDCDLGQSGACVDDRQGFQKLVGDVSQGRVGIVLTLDVSRLSRNCRDWHALLEACASHETLILVKDEVYDLACEHDRLLLSHARPMSQTDAPRPVPRVVDRSFNV
jgi:DNA invertase Pin-like site-specific DNA recombinase